MKLSNISYKTFCLILTISSLFVFKHVSPNRTNLKFIDANTFLYAHLTNLYQCNLQNDEKKIICKLRYGNLFTGILTDPKDLTTYATIEGAFSSSLIKLYESSPDFIQLDESFPNKINLYYQKTNASHAEYADRLCISQNGESLIHTNKLENSIKCVNTTSNSSVSNNLINWGLDLNDLRAADLTDDGKIIVLNFYKNGTLYVWNTDINKVDIINSGLGSKYFFDFALSPNGEKVASISSGAELWDTTENTFETIFYWDPDTKDINFFSCNQKIDLRRQSDYKKLSSLKLLYDRGNPTPDYLKTGLFWGKITKAIFSEDSNYIFFLINLYAKRDTSLEYHWRLKIFDIKNSIFIKTIEMEANFNPESIEDMAISPDGNNLILIDRYAKNLSSYLLIDDINVTLIPIVKN